MLGVVSEDSSPYVLQPSDTGLYVRIRVLSKTQILKSSVNVAYS